MTRALVTGVTGQDGSYLAEALVARGWEVHGITRSAHGENAVSDFVTVHLGDLAEPGELASIMAEVSPDVVFNLAGVSSVAYSWKRPFETGAVSGLAVTGLLDAAWRLQEQRGREVRFVQASSSEIFGAARMQPQTEVTPIDPVSPYGAAKAFAHHQVKVFRGRGMLASNAILYNHESPRRPESFVTRKITLAAAAIARGEQEHLALGNLEARRDWGWAPDYVEAMIRMAEASDADDYVVATGKTHSVREFAIAALLAAGVDDAAPRVTSDPRFTRPSDAPEMRGDSTRLRERLGWAPSKDFTGIVAAMVQHDLDRPSR